MATQKKKNFKGGWFEKECQVEKEAGSKRYFSQN